MRGGRWVDAPTLATISASKACAAWVGTNLRNLQDSPTRKDKLMADKNPKKANTGAWVIHHGRKLVLDSKGAAEYPVAEEVSDRHKLSTADAGGGSRLQTITRTG
jgi:hypothetical protein